MSVQFPALIPLCGKLVGREEHRCRAHVQQQFSLHTFRTPTVFLYIHVEFILTALPTYRTTLLVNLPDVSCVRRGGVPHEIPPKNNRFMMGQDLGVVAIVDSLKVLKEQSMWKQSEPDEDMPIRPNTFKLSGKRAHTVCLFCCARGGLLWALPSLLCAHLPVVGYYRETSSSVPVVFVQVAFFSHV